MVGDKNKHKVNSIAATINCSQKDLSQVQHLGLGSFIEQSLEKVLPLLDRKFENKLVRLDRLSVEVDIKNNRLPDLSNLLAQAVSDALENVEEKQDSSAKNKHFEIKNIGLEEVFLYFLQHGEMPWFAAKLEWGKFDFSNPSFTTNLGKLLNSSTTARERLASQFTVSQVKQVLLLRYSANTVTALFKFISLISENAKNYSQRFAAGFRLQQKTLKAFLAYAEDGVSDTDLKGFYQKYWPSFTLEVKKECNGKHQAFLDFLLEESASFFKLGIPLGSSTNALPTLEADNIVHKAENRVAGNKEALEEIWKEENSDAKQMMVNTGVILLHPFLSRFFTKVGLLEKNQFISLEHQQRGICLLHHLATGELNFPEEKLGFFKHLCNYPLKQSVPKELPISEFELGEMDTVLDSAIEHWTALKRTSKNGLRVNFLQRKGLLEKDAIGHTLHVESHAADILLDQLPWGLSTVHFPWLPELLTIKWR